MLNHSQLTDTELHSRIRKREIAWGGNRRLKIYGTLHCASGKRMLRKNRVFFRSETEARKAGFRPCGHCLRNKYNTWKHGLV